jgi:hypothetical protein
MNSATTKQQRPALALALPCEQLIMPLRTKTPDFSTIVPNEHGCAPFRFSKLISQDHVCRLDNFKRSVALLSSPIFPQTQVP